MKFSKAKLGKRAELPIEFEHRGEKLVFAFRPLDGEEEATVLERATEFARVRKADECKPGNPLFDYGQMVHSLALAAIDVDSPVEKREPYFDGGEADVLAAFGQEEVAFLYARYDFWQGECSPTRRQMTPKELLTTIIDIARSETDLPFSSMRPSMQLLCLRSMARLLLNSQDLSSLSTSLFNASQTKGPIAAEIAEPKPSPAS